MARGRRLEKFKAQPEQAENESDPNNETVQPIFLGILDRQELEYFKNAESVLAAGTLSHEEQKAFVDNVFVEAKGKELKLVTNQVCSKLVERLVSLCERPQLSNLLKTVTGHAVQLALQKYSSHCLEAILLRAAREVEAEMLEPPTLEVQVEDVTPIKSMVLYLTNELQENIKQLSQNKYASHVLRLSLLVLAGLPLGSGPALRSKKSSSIRKYISMDQAQVFVPRQVPAEFKEACNDLSKDLVSVLGLDNASSVRSTAIDSLGSPLLQVLIRIQASRSNYTLIDLALEEEKLPAFLRHVLSDKVGSHFLEALVEVMPKRKATKLYEGHLASNILEYAKQEASSFVVVALLNSELTAPAKESLVKELASKLDILLEAGRVDLVSRVLELQHASAPAHFAESVDLVVKHFGGLDAVIDKGTPNLFGALVKSPEHLNAAVHAFASLDVDALRALATHPVQSRCMEKVLLAEVDIVERRRFLAAIVPLCGELAAHSCGSHILDGLWVFCYKLKFGRERIAEQILKHEEAIKRTVYGRRVFKNWHLDKYRHQRHEWWVIVKAFEDSIEPKEKKSPKSPKPRAKPYDRKPRPLRG